VVCVLDCIVFFNFVVMGKLGWLVEIGDMVWIFSNFIEKVIEDYIFGCFG